jgi:hypothetical protein
MLTTVAVELETDSLVAQNGSHHFRLKRVSDPGFETEVSVTYHPKCGVETCTPPKNSSRWILLCLDTSWNRLFDLEISVGPVWRQSSPVRWAVCGPCLPQGPSLRALLPRSPPQIQENFLSSKGGISPSTPLLSSPHVFAAGIAIGISAFFLVILFLIRLIRPKIDRAPRQ